MLDKLEKHIHALSLNALADFGVENAVIAIGVFDGVHIGHQALLKRLLIMAERENAVPVALTFHPHPKRVLRPNSSPKLLISPDKKLALLHHYGVKAVVTIPFTREFADFSPEEFIHQCLLAKNINLRGICVGSEWRFGRKGEGDTNTLREFADKGHFSFDSVDEELLDGNVVSSTVIRRALAGGDLDLASTMLGRHYTLAGDVIHGRKIATGKLSYPTANISVQYGVLPPNGVYAGRAICQDKRWPAAIAIGLRPTFNFPGDQKPALEVHLLDFSSDIYEQKLEVELIRHIREERCYSSANSLKTQIASDISEIKRILNEE